MKFNYLILITAFVLSTTIANAQSVTLKRKGAELQDVLREIYTQTSYYFYGNSEVLKKAHKVSINVKEVPLQTALDICFKDQPFDYLLDGKVILITEKKIQTPVIPAFVLRGRILNEKGEPVEGASVMVKNGSKSAVTDSNGVFLLESIDPQSSLLISNIGYEMQEIPVKRRSGIEVQLALLDSRLDEVQIIGYGSTTKRLNTGSVGSVKASTIAMQPVANPLLALQGRVAGLLVTQTNGLPGSPVNVQIRGRNSIAANSNPLYIIDGVPFTSVSVQILGGPNSDGSLNYGSPMNLVNPQDIESVEILKDADATAIYGSRGANGVVLVNTKKAKPGKLQVNAFVNTGFGKITKLAPTLNTTQYLQVRRDGLKNSNVPVDAANAPDLVTWDTTRYFDWQGWYMGNTATNTSANASVSGGSDQTQYFLSGTFHQESTVLPGNTSYKRGAVHLSLEHASKNKRFSVGTSVFYNSDRNRLTGSVGGGLSLLVAAPPNYPVHDEAGQYYWITGQNNFMALQESYYKGSIHNFNGNASFRYNLFPNLDIKVLFGYNRIASDEIRATPVSAKRPLPFSQQGSSFFGNQYLETYLLEPQANYTRQWNNGKLELLVGGTLQKNITDGRFFLANGFVSDDLLEDINKGTIAFGDSNNIDYKYISAFGRINYNLKNKYIFNGNIRRDGSSRFGPGRQFGNFFSVAGAWIFSKENMITDQLDFISFGKLRMSYGTTGNDGIADYGFINMYSQTSPYGNTDAIAPFRPANPDYRWELNRKFEVGVELGIFKNRLLLSSSWYRNISSNQLLQFELPTMTGFSGYLANLKAEVLNKGWEVELNSVNIKQSSFGWTTHVNLTFPANSLKSFPGLENSVYANQFVIGRPLDNIQALRFIRINPSSGLAEVRDINNDGIINASLSSYNNQKGDRVIVGQFSPYWYGGMLNTVRFRNFQLDIFLQFIKQDGYNLKRYYKAGAFGNTWTAFLDYWKTPGQETDFPLPQSVSTAASSIFSSSDVAVVDASFLRVKNISLSYVFPPGLTRSLKLSYLTVYIQGQNLFTLTRYSGYDPETSGNSYLMVPTLKMLVGGVKLSL